MPPGHRARVSDPVSDSPFTFMNEFARSPRTVASLTPSGRVLSRQIAVSVPASGDPVVVELGPGTGAFTQMIQTTLAGRGHHVAIDVNDRFTTLLADRFPGVEVVTADARRIGVVLGERGLDHADVVISGLPWAAFGRDLRSETMTAVADALTPDGAFTTFAYLHALWSGPARRFRRLLDERFEEVVAGRTVWANLPPAFVYHCRRPRRR